MQTYELIEHTADIGIRLKAKSLEELFKRAALAMFDIIAEKKPSVTSNQSLEKIIIKQKADSLDELFVNWLNELLSLSATKEIIFSDFRIIKLTEKSIEAVALGKDTADYKVNVEIKAATYHELKIEKCDSDKPAKVSVAGWQVQVIFDV